MRNTMWFVNTPSKHETLIQCWTNAGLPSARLAQHETSTGSTPRVCWSAFNEGLNVGQRCTRWPGIGLMHLTHWQHRVLASIHSVSTSCWRGCVHIVYTTLVPFKCWSSIILLYQHDTLNQSWVNVGLPSVTLAHIQHGAKHDTVT